MAAFSGAVKLANLDDYLAPSQACVKPMLKPAAGDDGAPRANKGRTVTIEVADADVAAAAARPPSPSGSHFQQIRADATKKTATVSLNDCLACRCCARGCIRACSHNAARRTAGA